MSHTLTNLCPVSVIKKKRRGRGVGSGLGKTSGRGVKGQKARAGHSSVGSFAGGQSNYCIRLPKYGFNNFGRSDIDVVTTDQILHLLKKGCSTSFINKETLFSFGLIRSTSSFAKLIRGKKVFVNIIPPVEVDKCSVGLESFVGVGI